MTQTPTGLRSFIQANPALKALGYDLLPVLLGRAPKRNDSAIHSGLRRQNESLGLQPRWMTKKVCGRLAPALAIRGSDNFPTQPRAYARG